MASPRPRRAPVARRSALLCAALIAIGSAGAAAVGPARALRTGEAAPTGAASTPAPVTALGDGAASPAVSLVRQPAWTRVGGNLPIRLRVAGARPGLDLRFTLYGRLSSRTAFELTTLGDGLGSAVGRVELPLDEKAVSDDGELTAMIVLSEPESPREPDRLPATHTGVYPMRVEMVDSESGGSLSDFVTWVVAVEDGPVDTPLAVTWIWQISAPPLDRPDGRPSPEVLAQMEPDGRLHRIAELLAAADGVPLTLALSPETLESWRDASRRDESLADGYDSLRSAAARPEHQLLPAPYVPIEVPALEAAGLGAELVPELIAGTDTLEELLDRRVDPRTAFVDPVDAAAIDRLRQSFVDRIAIRDEVLVPAERNLTPARPFTLATATLSISATSTNPGLYSLLEGAHEDALLAQRFLAGLSLVALEAPALQRGLVFASPSTWDPRSEVVRLVLAGQRNHPLLDPVTLDDYFATVPEDTFDDSDEHLVRLLASPEPGSLPITAAQLVDARITLESFRSIVGDDDDRIRRAERSLLLALTTSWSRERAAAELAVLGDAADAFLSGIKMTEQSVTITARRASIPLSFVNDTGRPVRVRVSMASSKLLFPDGSDRVVELAEGNTTESFVVDARTNGTFTMSVTLTSEDGRLPIGAPAQVTVRATVFSGVGAFLTIGAVLFLAGWWANHMWRIRRARRPPPGLPAAEDPTAAS